MNRFKRVGCVISNKD